MALTDLMTTAEVADELKVSIKTVQRLGALGHIRCIKLPGRTGGYLFDRVDIETWIRTAHTERQAS